jgi:hypothetical protein
MGPVRLWGRPLIEPFCLRHWEGASVVVARHSNHPTYHPSTFCFYTLTSSYTVEGAADYRAPNPNSPVICLLCLPPTLFFPEKREEKKKSRSSARGDRLWFPLPAPLVFLSLLQCFLVCLSSCLSVCLSLFGCARLLSREPNRKQEMMNISLQNFHHRLILIRPCRHNKNSTVREQMSVPPPQSPSPFLLCLKTSNWTIPVNWETHRRQEFQSRHGILLRRPDKGGQKERIQRETVHFFFCLGSSLPALPHRLLHTGGGVGKKLMQWRDASQSPVAGDVIGDAASCILKKSLPVELLSLSLSISSAKALNRSSRFTTSPLFHLPLPPPPCHWFW